MCVFEFESFKDKAISAMVSVVMVTWSPPMGLVFTVGAYCVVFIPYERESLERLLVLLFVIAFMFLGFKSNCFSPYFMASFFAV